jgi:hypothetical protein
MNQVVKKEYNNFLKGKKKEYFKKIECLIKDIQNSTLYDFFLSIYTSSIVVYSSIVYKTRISTFILYST